MDEFWEQLADEARGLRRRLGFRRPGWPKAIITHLLVWVLFGMVLPLGKGVAFLDSVIVGAYACLGLVFAAPAAAAPFDEPKLGRAVSRITLCVVYGTVMAWTILLTGLAVVYATASFFIGLDSRSLVECALFGVALAAAAATVAVWVTVRFSAGGARAVTRLLFLCLLVAFFWYSRWLPDVALRGAVIAGIVAAAFVAMLHAALAQRRPAA